MAIKAFIYNPKSGDVWHSNKAFDENELLINADYAQVHSVFKTINMTTAATSQLVTPDSSGAVVITDIMISSDKTNATNVQLRFTDGTNIQSIFKGDSTNAPLQINHPFTGLLRGWKDARIDVETVGAVDATITVAYFKIKEADTFSVWDAKR